MKIKAAICWQPKKPLEVEEIELQGPRAGECLIRLAASGVCHTDAYTMSGVDPSGLFPSVLGHEGAGVVEEVGPGVTSLAVGDHVIPLYIPECRQCKFCLSGKTNLCGALLATQGQGLMPDGTSRISYKGKILHHYMGTSTFAEYSVVPEIALAKSAQGRAARQGLSARLRHHDRHRRRAQHRQGAPRRERRRLRPRRHRPFGRAGRRDGRRRAHHRHRHQPGRSSPRPAARRHRRGRTPARSRSPTSARRSST